MSGFEQKHPHESLQEKLLTHCHCEARYQSYCLVPNTGLFGLAGPACTFMSAAANSTLSTSLGSSPDRHSAGASLLSPASSRAATFGETFGVEFKRDRRLPRRTA